MTEREALKMALEALSPWAGEDANHTEQYAAYHALRKALAQPDPVPYWHSEFLKHNTTPVPYWHSEFLKHNTTSDHCMMENAQGELERIRLVQTGVGIGKPEQGPVAYWHKEFLKHNTTSDQPKQEPVAWMIWLHGQAGFFDHKQFAELEFDRRNKEYPDPDRKLLPLYTTPPQRTWQGLTDEEIIDVIHPLVMADMADEATDYEIARAIEAKLKEKNT